MRKRIAVALLALTVCLPCVGQAQAKDSVVHSPSRAALYSALLPGLGQIYNKRYWKLPLVYGGFAALGYFVQSNHFRYVLYLDAYNIKYQISQLKQDAPDYEANLADLNGKLPRAFENAPIERLQSYKNTYRRERDFYIIMMVLFYGINIIDATVDAHFFTYNVSNDLSFNLQPYVEGGHASLHSTPNAGLNFCITF